MSRWPPAHTRTWAAPSHSRSWPAPKEDTTILHLIGDIHAGAISQSRLDIAAADIAPSYNVPAPTMHVQVGDSTDAGTAAQDTTALGWLNSLPKPWITILGNHDVWNGVRTHSQWATATGMPAKDYVYDVGEIRLIVVSPDQWSQATPATVFNQPTLDWLDAQLAAADRNCLIFSHAPLFTTVVGPTTGTDPQWSSDETFFHSEPDATIRSILNTRTRAKAWISGHTHSPTYATGFAKTENVGSRSIFALNCSALWYTGRTAEASDQIKSFYLSCYSDRLEVRTRNHGAHSWEDIGGSRVVSFGL